MPLFRFAASAARETELVFRIAYCCVTTGWNTEYAIRTVADSLNVALATFCRKRQRFYLLNSATVVK